MASGGASNKVESMDTTQQLTSSSKPKTDDKVSSLKTDSTATSSKEDIDVVSQTKSGSAPVSVISSAQSLDPSKKDSG